MMETIQLVLSDPLLIYLLLVTVLSTLVLFALRYYKKKNNMAGTELVEGFIEEVQQDAKEKFSQRLDEKKVEGLTMEQTPLLPQTRNRESHKNINDGLIEDEKDETDTGVNPI